MSLENQKIIIDEQVWYDLLKKINGIFENDGYEIAVEDNNIIIFNDIKNKHEFKIEIID